MPIEPRTRMRVADWVGFLLYLGFAVATVMQSPGVRILLLPTIAYELFIAVAFLTREPARATLQDRRARVIAHAATFFIVVCFPLARRLNPEWFAPTTYPATALLGWTVWVAGSIVVAWSVWYLRRSFSIEPQARQLITSGPYRYARHPVYAGYLLQYVGMWMHFPTVPFGLLLVAWGTLVRERMRYEEQVLSGAFAEYAEYRRRVGALGPVRVRVPAGTGLIGRLVPMLANKP